LATSFAAEYAEKGFEYRGRSNGIFGGPPSKGQPRNNQNQRLFCLAAVFLLFAVPVYSVAKLVAPARGTPQATIAENPGRQ
jgi:hypothetical protein